jgi:hypothetical protein
MTGSLAGILRCEIVVRMFSTSTILNSRLEASLTSTSLTMSFHLESRKEQVLFETVQTNVEGFLTLLNNSANYTAVYFNFLILSHLLKFIFCFLKKSLILPLTQILHFWFHVVLLSDKDLNQLLRHVPQVPDLRPPLFDFSSERALL